MGNLLLSICLCLLFLAQDICAKEFDNIGVELSKESEQTQQVLKKADAMNWLADFIAAKDKTSDALFLKNFEKRQTHTRILMAIRDQAYKLFGNVVSSYGDCTKAIEDVNDYWKMEIALITDPANNQTIKVASLVSMTWDGGGSFISCQQQLKQLR